MKKHVVNIFFNQGGEVQLSKNDTKVPYRMGARAKVGVHSLCVTLGENGTPKATVDGKEGIVSPIPQNEHGFGFRIDTEVDEVKSMSEWQKSFA